MRRAAYPITAVLSIWLRSLCVGRGLGFGGHAFFYARQTSGANRLVQRIGFHAAGLRHLRHTPAFREFTLRDLQRFTFPHRCRSPLRLREEGFRAVIPQQFHVAFHGGQRNSEGIHDVHLAHGAHVDQLAGDQPEALQIAFGMLKHGQRTIDIHHLFVPTHGGDFIGDVLGSRRKNGQLQLRHG